MAKCRHPECQAPIVWLRVAGATNGGRPVFMPVNRETITEGDLVFDAARHTSHFDTCPFADDFRRGVAPQTTKGAAKAAAPAAQLKLL